MANKILRQTAYKVRISDLLSGKYVVEEGEWEPNYVLVKDMKVSRVNLIAVVIDKYMSEDRSYAYVDIDDSSGVIRVKAWREDIGVLENLKIGSMVLLIGRPKALNSEMYILAEIAKVLENNEWARVRKEELKKRFGDTARIEVMHQDNAEGTGVIEETIGDATATKRQKMLNIIEKNEEISFDMLAEQSEMGADEVDRIIKELIKEGEIYQPRAGVLKVV